MDTVFIEGLEVEAVIGAYAWERAIRQRLRLDLEMAYDCRAAGASDALADALDYHAVATAATAWVEASRFELLEALAEQLAAKLLAEFPIRRLRLRVRKPGAVANAAAVGVAIERGAGA
ncbi:dihydroneopterin aldolase [Fulvimonas soli]|uniref:7,8-dihydroneopterin aldolase n=1 Tax=Fulvimonas soli TaxID=155197 RepID=A0A316HTW8_9GAMM|nr:dihydroneopterin aldolase [Fulvimonas soli]PWK83879.1 dihydroneopterin aldolase [Fulvimonas soli]TNY25042.1 dihydroneopterin aldolase [Fulvimonas soli]